MLDWYGDMPGPTRQEASDITSNTLIKKNERKNLTEITNDEIHYAIDKMVENMFPNSGTVGSFSGWQVFFAKDLETVGLKKIIELNEIKKENKGKISMGIYSLKENINDNIIKKIYDKMIIKLIV